MTIWRAGMLAVCVDDGPPRFSVHYHDGQWWKEWGDLKTPLTSGNIYRVTGVSSKYGITGLRFRGNVKEYWLADRFRPAVLDNEPCEKEFITLLKRSKPTLPTAPLPTAQWCETGGTSLLASGLAADTGSHVHASANVGDNSGHEVADLHEWSVPLHVELNR